MSLIDIIIYNYQIINAGEVQIDNIWFPCVVYQDIDNKKVYVRQESSFDSSFSAVKN